MASRSKYGGQFIKVGNRYYNSSDYNRIYYARNRDIIKKKRRDRLHDWLGYDELDNLKDAEKQYQEAAAYNGQLVSFDKNNGFYDPKTGKFDEKGFNQERARRERLVMEADSNLKKTLEEYNKTPLATINYVFRNFNKILSNAKDTVERYARTTMDKVDNSMNSVSYDQETNSYYIKKK